MASQLSIEHAGKDTYFRDVHLFTERIKDIAAVKNAELVRNNLNTCLRGTALACYTGVLTDNQKRLVKLGGGVEEWVHALLKRFKESPQLTTITKERYTMEDARRRREPFEYAQTITRAAKSTNMTTFSQIYLIYNGLELKLQRDLSKPTEQTTMEAFLQETEDNKEIWWDLGARYRGGFITQASNLGGFNRPSYASRSFGQCQSHEGYRGGGVMGTGSGAMVARSGYANTPPLRNHFPTSYQFKSTPYQQYGAYQNLQQRRRPPYGGASPNHGRSYSNRNTQASNQGQAPSNSLVRPVQPSGNPVRPQGLPQVNQDAYGGQQQQQRQPFKLFNNYNNQAQQWRPPATGGSSQPYQRAFHGETNENQESPHDEPYNEDLGDDTTYDYDVAASEEPSYGYQGSNNDLDADNEVKPLGNQVDSFFVQAATSRIRDVRFCRIKPRLTIVANQGETVVIEAYHGSAPLEQSEGLGFRSWHYAMVKGSIQALDDDAPPNSRPMSGQSKSTEDEADLTPDTGCTMSVIDRKFLASPAPGHIIKHTPQPVRVRGLGNAILSSSEYVYIEITLRGKLSNGIPVIGKLRRHIHIVDNLKWLEYPRS